MGKGRVKRLAIVTTHPIQYNAPLFEHLASRKSIDIHVFYTWSQSIKGVFDHGFQKNINWDIPLLRGYNYTFIENISSKPGTHHFKGIINNELILSIEEWQPDAILVYGWSFHSHLKCLRYFHKKIPVLFRGDSTLLDSSSWGRKILRSIFLTWLYRHVDFALCVGTQNKMYFQHYGLADEQLIDAPHAVDNDRFFRESSSSKVEAKKWRRSLNIDDSDIVLLYAGKLEKKKDPFFLLKLSEQCKSDKIKFIFVGNGELEKELKEAAQADERFRFIDFQNQSVMPLVYGMANVFILPSKGPGETWGLALNEAMASGLPVIASDKCGGAYDLITPDTGLMFAPGDVRYVAEFLMNLQRQPSLAEDYKMKTKQRIEQFSFLKVCEAIEGILLKLN